MWQMLKYTVKPIFSTNQSAIKYWGGAFLVGVVIVVIYIASVTKSSVRYDALAVWQHKMNGNWKIAFSIYSADKNLWTSDILKTGKNDAVEKVGHIPYVEGDNQDPDISSTQTSAIAVWSNTGAKGNAGADIFYSQWKQDETTQKFTWSKSEPLAHVEGDDLDPSVYVADSGNAMAVWLNKAGGKESIYFAEYKNGIWSKPKAITLPKVLTKITGVELAFNKYYTKYLLSFTAQTNGKGKFFYGIYNKNGWRIIPVSANVPAMVDVATPNSYRTSLVVYNKSTLAASYTGSDNSLWIYKAQKNKRPGVKRIASEATRPVLLADTSSARALLSEPALLAQYDIEGKNKRLVSQAENGYTRLDAVNLFDGAAKRSLAVWSKFGKSDSDIAFSSYKSRWAKPEYINYAYKGEELAPAVTPILITVEKNGLIVKREETPIVWSECGDGVLNKVAGEVCEIGVACGSPSQVCDWDVSSILFPDCECLDITEDGSEGEGTGGKNKKRSGGSGGWFPKGWFGPQREDKSNSNTNTVYRGSGCGFDAIALSTAQDDQMQVTFDPTPTSGKEQLFSRTGENKWSVVSNTGTMKIFPGASNANQPDAIVFLTIKDNKVFIEGLQANTGFVLCTGEFTKGKKAKDAGRLTPASAN